MSLINFITKTVFYVTAILTPIIFFKAAINPITLINLSDNTVLICTLGSIECIPLMTTEHILPEPVPQTIEVILSLSSINVPELINSTDIQIMSKIASLDRTNLKEFSKLIELPYQLQIGVNTRDFFTKILTTEHDTLVLWETNGLNARIHDLLDYYLTSRNNTLNGLNPEKNFLKMLKLHIENPEQINEILANTLDHVDLAATPYTFDMAINKNIEPFPGYNELESMKNVSVVLKEEIPNNNEFSCKLQEAAKGNYESLRQDIKNAKNNMWPLYFIICVTTMLTSGLIMAYSQ